MELKFENIQELEKFIEKLGYVKKDKKEELQVEELQIKDNPLTLTIKECPYGFMFCPYNKIVDPYKPLSPFYYNQETITSIMNNDNVSNICEKKQINNKITEKNET